MIVLQQRIAVLNLTQRFEKPQKERNFWQRIAERLTEKNGFFKDLNFIVFEATMINEAFQKSVELIKFLSNNVN